MQSVCKVLMRLLFLLLFCCLEAHPNTVYIVHIGGIDTDRYFYDDNAYRDEVGKPYRCLREAIEAAGYQVRFTHDALEVSPEDCAGIISFSNNTRALCRNLRCEGRGSSSACLSRPSLWQTSICPIGRASLGSSAPLLTIRLR